MTDGFSVARLRRAIAAFHRNETGAEEGANKLLIFALVALPLLALLIIFGKDILDFAKSMYENVVGKGGSKGVKPPTGLN